MTSGKIELNLLLIGFAVSLLSLIVAYWKYIQKDIAA